jgi:aldehyde:ferredoxin oxidoreductase
MKLLRVNMSSLETTYEDLPEEWKILGGRGLSAQILTKEVPPDSDPLGPDNKLIIAGGPLAGTLAPSCGRISVGAKSPLTRGIKEANAGGPAVQKLDRLGIRAIIIEGAAEEGKLYLLKVTSEGATLKEANDLQGKMNYPLSEELLKKYDEKGAIVVAGLAGERKSKGSAVSFTDKDGHCSRHAGRGGLGAVMGSKGLKAIMISDRGTSSVEIADKDAFSGTLKEWAQTLKEDPQVQGMSTFGTPSGVVPLRGLGSMPSRNYSSEQTEGFENLGGENLKKLGQERGGKMDGCMPGCLVKCSIIFHDADGKHVTSGYEYETVALMGTNLGISDADVVAEFDRACDDMGLDTIELGSAMGVAASAGKMDMGDADSARKLLDEVKKGTELGTTLANGVVETAKALGVTRIPAFKGQAIPAHDPRVTKATGVTYATSPMGADHTAGISYKNPLEKNGQVDTSLTTQVFIAMLDSMGYCTLASTSKPEPLLDFLVNLTNARFGLNISAEDLMKIGKETLQAELKFNEGSEFHTANEPDPEFVRTESLAPTGSVFDVDQEEIATIWDKLDKM